MESDDSSRSLDLAAAAFEARLNRALTLVDAAPRAPLPPLLQQQQQPQQQQQLPVSTESLTPRHQQHARQDSEIESPALWNKTVAMLADIELRQKNLEQTRVAVAMELEHAKKMMVEARALWTNAQAMKQDLEAKQAKMEQECVCKNRAVVRIPPPSPEKPIHRETVDHVHRDTIFDSSSEGGEREYKQLSLQPAISATASTTTTAATTTAATTTTQPTQPISRKFFKNSDAEEVRSLQWGPILQSKVTMWHRPKRQHIKYLKDENCSLIISVQSEKEFVSEVGKDCSKFGIRWIHIPLEGANETLLSGEESIGVLLEGLYAVYKMLNNNQEKALLHCAAGIHRTGVCTYVLARVAGRSKKDATAFLRQLREVTAAQVGDWRLQLAEEILIPRLKERIQHQISVNNLKLV